MEKAYLTVSEVILSTGLGRTKLYEEINSGRLKAKKCGRRTLIPITAYNAWLINLDDYISSEKTNGVK